MLKPNDFSEHKKYPVLMYVYGGPGSQEVNNAYDGINNAWFQLLAQQGFLVFCVDGRGTGCKGADFKKITYKNLGKNEIEDQKGKTQEKAWVFGAYAKQ
jgi:dipeptidyl-peptidase-4